MTPVESLHNLGPQSVSWLREAGVETLADLESLGAIGAFQSVWALGYRPTVVFAYALQGALINCHWNQLPVAMRDELKEAVAAIRSD